ncbi:MAG: tandem-95 repeat protein, partial [Planctomycetes bacterium]|nr:tandem-95 repeat protein [Planctomycetota bacterium]
MNKFKLQQWFKSVFDFESLFKSKHPRPGRLSVEPLEIRLTPDANSFTGFHDFGKDSTGFHCVANSIAIVDDIRLLQNSADYRANQVYFCSNNSPDFPDSTFQSLNKLDALALQAAASKGVVIIDSSLFATIPAEELKGSLIVLIDGNLDVVSQITTALEGLANVPVLRIISHGSDGVLWFGNKAFDSTYLNSSATQVASWGKSLTADGDILLYGCSVANTDAGKAFVQQFASITQADIAASSNLTGKGGDEVLEFQVGQVSNSLIASAIDYDSANVALVQFTVTTTADAGAGSLRQAIADANATSANDEIIFASSLFTNGANTITLGSSLPTIATTTSAGTLTITGPGASSLIISGNNGDVNRNFGVFNIASGGNLAISGVTVSGVQTNNNGGAFNNAGSLAVSNSLVTGNTAAGGGGIFNTGNLNVSNSTFSNNSTTSQNGGAIWNYGGIANSSISNSTISSNSATTSSGGGISNTGGAVTLSNSTLFGNKAAGGGGIFNNANGTFTIFNSTISNNSASVSGGGVHIGSGTLNISNTIIANSTSGDVYCVGSIGTNASNLVEDGSLPGTSELTGDPNLGALQNNGGSTFTMALGAGSIAIGAGNSTISNASPINRLDQRGVVRSATAPSIGALESINKFLYNIPQTSTFGYGFYNSLAFSYNSEKYAQRFLTQSDSSVITDIKLNIWTDLPNSGTYTVKIYSDNSGNVGSSVATVGTRNILDIYYPSGTITPAVFSGLNIRLTPGTAYWMVVESDTGVVGSGMYWGCGGSGANPYVANPTTAAKFNYDATPQWQNLFIPALGMQVSAIPAPVANPQSITPNEDITYTGTLTGSSANGNNLDYSIVAGASKGVVKIINTATGAFTYVPNANANGVDTFTFKVNDGVVDSAAATVSVNITPVNDAPISNAQTITATEDTTYTGALTGSDVDGNVLIYSVVSPATKGVVTITNPATGAFTYVPNANANGSDSFSFKVNDGSLDSAAATVTVNITAVNDAPVASSSSVTLAAINEDTVNSSGATIQNLFGSLFSDSADGQGPVTETFAVSTGGWSNATLDSSTAWGSFLGRFGANTEISKTFALGGNSSTINFDFLRIDSWDGEFFRLYANDVLIINQQFYCNQRITTTLSGSANGYSWTMLPTDYGANLAGAGWDDQKFYVTLNVPAGLTNLTLRLNSTLDQAAGDESWGIDNFKVGASASGYSTSNTFAGIAISSYTVDAYKGNWQYSTDATTWLNLATATISDAITLKATDSLRFVPAANYNGQATALSANLIETGGSAIISGAPVNLSGVGGATVYSATAVSLANTVTPINDAPTLAAISVGGTEDNTVTFSAADFTGGTVASPGIAYVGLQADMGAAWRTASTPKTYDIDGNNVLGSNGWWLPNYSYALVDNPLTTPGASPSLIYSGTTNGQFPGYGIKSSNSVVSFTLTGVVPGTIRVGIMTGNTDLSGEYGASGYQIVCGSLDSGMTTELQTNGGVYNGNPDWVFFDITGGIAGQTYSIYAKGGPRGNAGIGAISFDSITPAYSDAENNPLVSITVVTLPATGVLKLSGVSVSVGQVITAANLGNLTYVPAANENGIKTFTVTASDGSASSSPATTVSMDIAPVNDPPVIGGLATSVNYISTDFTTAPANATLSGSAVISNGECVLTPALSGQYGYLLFNTLASNSTTFSAQFDYRVADGNGADGTSFNYGVIDSPNGGEWGMTNTGLVVSLIEYGTQRVEIKLNGTVLQTAYVTLIGPNYKQIIINVDGSNRLSVSVGGVVVINNLDLGANYGNADKSSWKFGFASRCGGANNKHSIDNLVISNNVAPVTALEQTPSVLAGSLTLSDVDNSTLASAVVTITSGLKTSEDVLSFVANPAIYGNITSAYNSATGALKLTSAGATATLAQWQAALRSVTYINTSDTPDTTSRTVSFVVNDGTVNSAAATVTVNVTAVNDAPVANADTYTTTEDTPLVVSLGSPVVDQQQTTWNTGLPYNGYQTFTAGQTGFLTSIDLMQNGGASNPQQVTLTVYAGDGIGGVALGEVTISETNSYNFTLNGYIQTYTFSQPVAIFSGGVYTFKVLSSSNRGLVGSSNTNSYANGRFYHSGGNSGDLWFRTSVATGQGLLLNDSDAEGNSLTAVIVTNPSNGSVVLNSDGKFTYTPNANFNGTDTFSYKTSDGITFSNIATVTVDVNAVNDAPNVSASQPNVTLLDYQFTRNWGVSESFVTITKSDPENFVQYDEQYFAANGWTSSDNGVTVTKNLTYGYAILRPSTNVLTYYLNQQSNLTSRLRQGQTVTETIPVQVTDGQLTALTNAVFTIDGQNDEPELYRVNNLVGALEDSEYEISYASLTNNSQLADIDGGV